MRSFFAYSRVRAFAASAVFLVLAAPQPVGSQSAPRLSVIDGVVTDSALVPLGDATVSLLASSVRVVTGPNGRFRVRDLTAGAYVLLVRRIGYEAASLRVQVTPGDTASPSVALQRASTKLDAVSIIGQRLTPAMQEFESRRKLGEGHFITQAEIEKRNPVAVSDMFNGIPSVMVKGGMILNLRQDSCPFNIYVDGVKLPVGSIDNLAVPQEVAGIEIYAGAATIPLQYKSPSGSFCGVILLWTRIGS
jgi:carboxypeptidase family protein